MGNRGSGGGEEAMASGGRKNLEEKPRVSSDVGGGKKEVGGLQGGAATNPRESP